MPTTTSSAALLAALPKDRLLAELSVWSADLLSLVDDVARTEPFTDIFHIDVADGHFAPSCLFFPDQVARLREITVVPLHVHLMVEGSILLAQVAQFAEAGADIITVHPESGPVVDEAISAIHERGLVAGIVLKLETPVDRITPWLERVNFVTLLGTAIGVKGQGLAPEACDRLAAARRMIAAAGRTDEIRLAADGGIREQTVPLLRAAGAETVVMGSLAFQAPDLAARMAWLHALPGPAA